MQFNSYKKFVCKIPFIIISIFAFSSFAFGSQNGIKTVNSKIENISAGMHSVPTVSHPHLHLAAGNLTGPGNDRDTSVAKWVPYMQVLDYYNKNRKNKGENVQDFLGNDTIIRESEISASELAVMRKNSMYTEAECKEEKGAKKNMDEMQRKRPDFV